MDFSKCKLAYVIDEEGKEQLYMDGKQVYGYTRFKVEAGVKQMPVVDVSFYPTYGLFGKME
ncbi:hypothetical protein [Aneurinibacillus migulanus]|uniref:hypothetical protein n=1 Tax=Aneurinibacillus migulanus TaxID=47500 RepID=UPI00209E95E4|nr:hypothetical protein [Aneurinibacillus migulanus]MCP1355077.1 hypothetical protein [Aneurinibacillus migulanus]